MDDLERFVIAQKRVYKIALQEIRNGMKRSHWIWYIFPQLEALGSSRNAIYYGIKNKEEAEQYLKNKYLRNNLLEITEALLNINNDNITNILGYPDDLKVKSCMTLFYYVDPSINLFKEVIDKYYNGEFDEYTISLLENKENIKLNR